MTTACRVLRDEDALAFLRGPWTALYAADPGATPFQAPGWHTAWHATAGRRDGVLPAVVTVDGARPVALALQVTPSGAVPSTAPWADYVRPVGPGADDDDALEALVAGIEEAFGDRGVHLDEIPPGARLAEVLSRRTGWRPAAASRTARVTLPGRWAGLPESGEHATKLRRLRARGRVSVERSTDTASLLAGLDELVALHLRQWSSRPDVVAGFDEPAVRETYVAFASALGPVEAVVWRLLLDDRTLAAYLCFHRGTTCYAYRPAMDAAEFRVSPGHLLLRFMLAELASAGMAAFDLMRGEYAYKTAYADAWDDNAGFELAPAEVGR